MTEASTDGILDEIHPTLREADVEGKETNTVEERRLLWIMLRSGR